MTTSEDGATALNAELAALAAQLEKSMTPALDATAAIRSALTIPALDRFAKIGRMFEMPPGLAAINKQLADIGRIFEIPPGLAAINKQLADIGRIFDNSAVAKMSAWANVGEQIRKQWAWMEEIKLPEFPTYQLPEIPTYHVPAGLFDVPPLSLRENLEDTIRRVVQEELEGRTSSEDAAEGEREPDYGSDGQKRSIGFDLG